MKSKEKRDNLVGVLLTKSEREAMQRLSEETGATASSIMRTAWRKFMQDAGAMPVVEMKSGGLVSKDRPAAAQ